jgi:hypothetical protein
VRPTVLLDILLTRWFWIARLSTAGLSLIMIWRITMTEYIAMTPTEFLPILLAVGIVTALVFTYIKAIPAYNDLNKEQLRAGTITEKIKYGMDYLTANIVGFVFAVGAAVIAPGVIYVSYLGAEPEIWGCGLLAFVIAAVLGYGGTAVLSVIVDAFRDKVKISKLQGKE